MDLEEEDVGRAGAVDEGGPVGADAGEAEADHGIDVGRDGDLELAGEEGRFGDALLLDDAGVNRQRLRGGRVRSHDIFLPADAGATVGAVEVRFVGGEMAQAEFVVRHGEAAGCEIFVVGFAGAGDVAGAPAAVDEFPFVVVDFHRVPRVVAAFGGEGGVGCQGGVAEAFAVASDDDAFEVGFAG